LVMFWVWKLGPIDMGPVWSGYLGLTLMSAAGVAIGLLVSSLTKSQVIAFFITFVVLFALVTVDQVGDIASSPKLGAIIQYVSFHSHVQNFARGLIDTRSVLYFVSLTAFSLIVAFRALESRKWRLPMAMEKKARAATESGIYLLVIAGIVIVANLLGFLAHRRYDVTKTERFTLSKGSGRLVRELKRPITLKAYISNTGLAKIDAFTRDLDEPRKIRPARRFVGEHHGRHARPRVRAAGRRDATARRPRHARQPRILGRASPGHSCDNQ